jgi:hypothetical protein
MLNLVLIISIVLLIVFIVFFYFYRGQSFSEPLENIVNVSPWYESSITQPISVSVATFPTSHPNYLTNSPMETVSISSRNEINKLCLTIDQTIDEAKKNINKTIEYLTEKYPIDSTAYNGSQDARNAYNQVQTLSSQLSSTELAFRNSVSQAYVVNQDDADLFMKSLLNTSLIVNAQNSGILNILLNLTTTQPIVSNGNYTSYDGTTTAPASLITTAAPASLITTAAPTEAATFAPTTIPTEAATFAPTTIPTTAATFAPTTTPTTAAPTEAPTFTTAAPTFTTAAPTFTTAAPTEAPASLITTAAPTEAPTFTTAAPTFTTAAPTFTTAAPTFTTAAPTFTTAAPTTASLNITAAPTQAEIVSANSSVFSSNSLVGSASAVNSVTAAPLTTAPLTTAPLTTRPTALTVAPLTKNPLYYDQTKIKTGQSIKCDNTATVYYKVLDTNKDNSYWTLGSAAVADSWDPNWRKATKDPNDPTCSKLNWRGSLNQKQ